MAGLFLSCASRENLEKSIIAPVNPVELLPFLGAETIDRLNYRAEGQGLRCWAMTTTKRKSDPT